MKLLSIRAFPLCFALGALACGGQQVRRTNTDSDVLVQDVQSPSDVVAQVPVRELPFAELANPASPLVTFRVVFEAGSADDPKDKEGLTAATAMLMAEGGTQSLSYEQLSRALFPMAAQISWEIDRDMTVFVGQVHKDHLAQFYPIFRDVVLSPRMGAEDFNRVRTQMKSSLTLELRGNDDEELGKEVLQSLIFNNHPYGHPALGTEHGLAAITLEDTGAQRQHVFCRNRVLAGMAGNYSPELLAQFRQDLATLPATCAARAELPTPTRPHGVHVVIVDKPDASATAISIGFPSTLTRRDNAFPALQFVTNYLGLHRQSSGVLYNTIRELRGLNYGDYMYSEYYDQDGWSRFPRPNIQRRQQYVSLWLRPLRPNTAHFALRAAVRAVSNTLENGISTEAFERTRTFLNGYVSLYTQTEAMRLGYAIDSLWNGAPVDSWAPKLRSSWAALTPEQALSVAREHLTTQELWVAIIAPNARELAAAIGQNQPSPPSYDPPKPELATEDNAISTYHLDVSPENVTLVELSSVFR